MPIMWAIGISHHDRRSRIDLPAKSRSAQSARSAALHFKPPNATVYSGSWRIGTLTLIELMIPLQFVHTLANDGFPFSGRRLCLFRWTGISGSQRRVNDASSLGDWLDHFLDGVFVPCDGLALLKSVGALQRGDFETLHDIDEELTAIKPSAPLRKHRYWQTFADGVLRRLRKSGVAFHGRLFPQCNAPVAYAVVMSHRGLEDARCRAGFWLQPAWPVLFPQACA